MRANWSQEEIDIFTKFYPIRTANEMKEIFPQYSITQMNRKARRLGITKKKEVATKSRLENSIIKRNDLWSDEEKRIVLEKYPTLGAIGVKELLEKDRSLEQIKAVAYRLGIERKVKSIVWDRVDIRISDESIFSIQVEYKGR